MKTRFAYVALAVTLCSPLARAQDKAPDQPVPLPVPPDKPVPLPVPVPARKAVVPLKVQVVLSKFKGETKTASLPYTLPCNAEDRGSHLRMGIDVPVLTTPIKDGPASY